MDAENMSISKDYHTHTVYSHGKGTIEDNVKVALSKKLDEIAISDHGPGHIAYGISKNKFFEMREKIDEINKKIGRKMVKLGIEANIIDLNGKIDLDQKMIEVVDIVLAGYHFAAFSEHYCREAWIHGQNLWHSKFSTRSGKMKVINTDLIIKAIYNNEIDIITHPGAKADVDIREIAKACAERNTLLEINNRHGHLTIEEIREAMKEDVKFIIGSDAHVPCHVGNCEVAIERILESGVELERVINLRRKVE